MKIGLYERKVCKEIVNLSSPCEAIFESQDSIAYANELGRTPVLIGKTFRGLEN